MEGASKCHGDGQQRAKRDAMGYLGLSQQQQQAQMA